MTCKYFKQITSDDGTMIFGCRCELKDKENPNGKPIYAFDCKDCEDKVEEKKDE